MAAKDEDKKELWVGWTHDAISVYEEPDDLDEDDLLDDMVDSACSYADAMLAEYEERFSGGTARRRRRKKKSKLDEDPDDDPD
jgi:hypothetical protein